MRSDRALLYFGLALASLTPAGLASATPQRSATPSECPRLPLVRRHTESWAFERTNVAAQQVDAPYFSLPESLIEPVTVLALEADFMLEAASEVSPVMIPLLVVPARRDSTADRRAVPVEAAEMTRLLRPGDALVIEWNGQLHSLLVDTVEEDTGRLHALPLSSVEPFKAPIDPLLRVSPLPEKGWRLTLDVNADSSPLAAALILLSPEELTRLLEAPGCLPADPSRQALIGEAVLAATDPASTDLGLGILRAAAKAFEITAPGRAAALLHYGLMRAFFTGLGNLPQPTVAAYLDEVEALVAKWGEGTLLRGYRSDQLFALSHEAFRRGEFDLSMNFASPGLERWPDDLDLLSLGARLANDLGDHEQALRSAEMILKETERRMQELAAATGSDSVRAFLADPPVGPYPYWLRIRRFQALQQKAAVLQVSGQHGKLQDVGEEMKLVEPGSPLGYIVLADAYAGRSLYDIAILGLLDGAHELTARGVSAEPIHARLASILMAELRAKPKRSKPASRPGCAERPHQIEAQLRAEIALHAQEDIPYGDHVERLFRSSSPLWMIRDNIALSEPGRALVLFQVAGLQSSDGGSLTAEPEDLWCWVQAGDAVHFTDRQVHHVSVVYEVDPEGGFIRFADGWPAKSFLRDGHNAEEVAATLVPGRGGKKLLQITRREFLKVAVGLITWIDLDFANVYLDSGSYGKGKAWRPRMDLGVALLRGGGEEFEEPALELLRGAWRKARVGGDREAELTAAARLHAALKQISIARYWRYFPLPEPVRNAVDLSEEANTLNLLYVTADEDPRTGGLFRSYSHRDFLELARVQRDPAGLVNTLRLALEFFPESPDLLVGLAEAELRQGNAEAATEISKEALSAIDAEIARAVRPGAGEPIAVFLEAGRGDVYLSQLRSTRVRARSVRVLAAGGDDQSPKVDCAELDALLPINLITRAQDPEIANEAYLRCRELGLL